jgi:hypothetical protein
LVPGAASFLIAQQEGSRFQSSEKDLRDLEDCLVQFRRIERTAKPSDAEIARKGNEAALAAAQLGLHMFQAVGAASFLSYAEVLSEQAYDQGRRKQVAQAVQDQGRKEMAAQLRGRAVRLL